MIYVVDGKLTQITSVKESTFESLSIWERRHLEEWVRQTPQMLGEELLIVTTEFNSFVGSQDRLDILAIDRAGNLVVIELKRDAATSYADLQALRYAAMVSAMTIDKLLPHFQAYEGRLSGTTDTTRETLREHINNFVRAEDFTELSSRPRIILCAGNFSTEITTTVLWLRQYGVDISCVKISPHRLNENIVLVSNRVIPLEEAKNYLIDIQRKEEAKAVQAQARRRATITVLVESGLVKTGETIYLRRSLPPHIKYNPSDPTFRAKITGKLGQRDSLQWEKDGTEHSISGLTWKIFRDLHPEQKDPGAITGGVYWENEAGESLWDLAEEHVGRGFSPL